MYKRRKENNNPTKQLQLSGVVNKLKECWELGVKRTSEDYHESRYLPQSCHLQNVTYQIVFKLYD